MQRLPVSVQTLYADLVQQAWTGSYQELVQAGGSPYVQTHNGQNFWYLKYPSVNGHRRPDLYLGPDSPTLKQRIELHWDLRAIRDTRLSMTKALRGYRLTGPDPLSGKILSMLSEVGAFRLRAVVVGSAAFQTYSPMLGVRFPQAMGQTGYLDIAQFHSISVAVADEIDGEMLDVLQRIDPRFSAVGSPFDGRKVLKYAIKTGTQESFTVDFLCPRRGADRGEITHLDALNTDAQVLKFLDFLLFESVNAVSLYGLGIPVNVPAPERFAIHKLLVSRLRLRSAESQAKAGKDLAQAQALIEVLLEDRPFELAAAWQEARDRGKSWREHLDSALTRLPEHTASKIRNLPQ